MTTRDTPFAAGTPCWVDLLSSDPDRAKSFYGELLGWTAEDTGEEFGGYVNFSSDGHRVAGMVRNTPEMGSPDVWTTYVSTDDIQATVDRATEAGGTVMSPSMPVGDLGSMAVIVDPVGAVFGLWQPGQHTGFGKYNEPGSVSWDEHHSKDFATSIDFYQRVFGWGMDTSAGDTDDFRYYQGQVDGETVAGLMDAKAHLPEEVPSHWAVYFEVADVDSAVATAESGGATLVQAAMDTPYGRMADLRDPTGAMFKLHGDNKAEGS